MSHAEREAWEATRMEARVWYCGDDVCDCRQAQVDRITPNRAAGFPWILREEVWRGTFFTEHEGAREAAAELRSAAAHYGITLEDHPAYPYGIRRPVVL